MTISREGEKVTQQLIDDMLLSVCVGFNIPLSYLVTDDEQLKRIETKLKSENTNDTN